MSHVNSFTLNDKKSNTIRILQNKFQEIDDGITCHKNFCEKCQRNDEKLQQKHTSANIVNNKASTNYEYVNYSERIKSHNISSVTVLRKDEKNVFILLPIETYNKIFAEHSENLLTNTDSDKDSNISNECFNQEKCPNISNASFFEKQNGMCISAQSQKDLFSNQGHKRQSTFMTEQLMQVQNYNKSDQVIGTSQPSMTDYENFIRNVSLHSHDITWNVNETALNEFLKDADHMVMTDISNILSEVDENESNLQIENNVSNISCKYIQQYNVNNSPFNDSSGNASMSPVSFDNCTSPGIISSPDELHISDQAVSSCDSHETGLNMNV